MEEPGRLQSMGSLRVRHDWATSLSLFTFMHWRRKWQPTPVFLSGERPGTVGPGGQPSTGLHRVGHDWSDLAAAAGGKLGWVVGVCVWSEPGCRQKFRNLKPARAQQIWAESARTLNTSLFSPSLRERHTHSPVVQAYPTPWTLRPHGPQHAGPPCPSPAPGACSDSCPNPWTRCTNGKHTRGGKQQQIHIKAWRDKAGATGVTQTPGTARRFQMPSHLLAAESSAPSPRPLSQSLLHLTSPHQLPF